MRSQQNACIENLKQIFYAKATWALETKQNSTATPQDTDLFGTTLYIREKPACPANGTYSILAMDTKPLCSIAGHTL